jgi:hypothetical protein
MRPGRLIAISVLAAWLSMQAGAVSGSGEARALTADHPSLAWRVTCLEGSPGDRFVQVDIAEVINPRSVELAFQVHYQPDGAEPVYLGGFALFPPERPGRFIVPAQGKVGSAGRILLSLEPIQDSKAAGAVRVVVRRLQFSDGP